MNRELIARHNAVVKPEEHFWHLGDFSMSEKYVPLIKQMNGIAHLCAGNHDILHPANRKYTDDAIKRYIAYGFSEVVMETRIGPFLVSHMPYTDYDDERHKERYSQYRPKDIGEPLLCGHIHKAFKVKDAMINVGCDVWDYAPVSYEELVAIKDDHSLKKKLGLL